MSNTCASSSRDETLSELWDIPRGQGVIPFSWKVLD